MGSKVRAGIASAALAVAVVGGVAVASSGSGDRPSLEQTTVGGEPEQIVETTTTVAVVETTVPVETSAVPETTAPPTTAAPATTVPAVQMVTVPSLNGLLEASAVDALQGLGLNAVVVYEVVEHAAEGGRVLSTSPGASTSVKAGTTVTITVAKFEPQPGTGYPQS